MYLFLTKWKPLSHIWLFVTSWTIQSMEFSRPEYRGSSQPRDRTQVSHNAGGFFTSWATREALVFENQQSHFFLNLCRVLQAFPSFTGSAVKNPPDNAGDAGLIPGLGRSPGGGNGNSLQYSCLGNPMDRGAWRATVHGVLKSWAGVTEQWHRVLQLTKRPNAPINQGTRAKYALIF